MLSRFLLVLFAWFLSAAPHLLAQRQTVDLPDGWRFLKQDAALDAPVGGDWQSVTVPHCWNAFDGQNGKAADPGVPGGYYRGPAWYVRVLDIPGAWRDKRVFVRFGAAFLVADVYLNGQHLGQHRGGFAAFCYELTGQLKFDGPNELRVRVDNSRNADIAPLSADFTMEGGIYRPVQLLVMARECITPLDFAGPGVYATPSRIDAGGADVEIETKLDSTVAERRGVVVRTEIRDADDQPAASLETQSANTGPVKQSLHIANPHLWNGIGDPYVYRVNVKLLRGGEVLDEVTQPLGFRTVEITEEDGFLLNGRPYPVHGVNRHQEKRDKGWALTPEDHAEDLRLIREMGATAVRLAHYQQSPVVHDLADRDGLLLWQEIPLVDSIGVSPAFAENALQQLTEEIRQCSNHPSIMTWSLFNELDRSKSPPVEPLIGSLAKKATELDPARTASGVTCHPDHVALSRLTPWIGFNMYPGWYTGSVDDYETAIDRSYQSAGGKRVAITEYGAGGNPAQHQEGALVQPKTNGPFHPEEYQAYVHERAWANLRGNHHLWSTFVWAMFDFAVDSRNEGSTPGINDKGLVTEDRRTRKDAYFFYKANWNPEPMVYIASRRSSPRQAEATEVKAYSNAAEVELKLNGQSLGTVKPDDLHICRWQDVHLRPGANAVETTGRVGATIVNDRCDWTLEAPATP